jgi:hypothetical protein
MTSAELREFRCVGCGAVVQLAAGFHTRRLDDPPCEVCDGRSWVRCGTFTEYLEYGKRDDVCDIGDHIDPRTRACTVYSRDQPREDPMVIRVCPSHHDILRHDGFLGFFPRDED